MKSFILLLVLFSVSSAFASQRNKVSCSFEAAPFELTYQFEFPSRTEAHVRLDMQTPDGGNVAISIPEVITMVDADYRNVGFPGMQGDTLVFLVPEFLFNNFNAVALVEKVSSVFGSQLVMCSNY